MRIVIITIVCFLFWVTAIAQEPKLMLPIGHTVSVNYVEFSRDGTKAATASDDKTAKIWDVESGRLLGELTGHKDQVTKVHFSPDGSRLITFTTVKNNDRVTRIWDARTFKLIKMLPEPSESFSEDYDPSFSSNNKWIVTVDGTKICLWDAHSGQFITSVVASNKSFLTCARFSSDAMKIVSASGDLTVNVWRIETSTTPGKVGLVKITGLKNLRNFNESIQWDDNLLRRARPEVFFSPNGKSIVTIIKLNRFVQISDAETGDLIVDFEDRKSRINDVCFNQNDTLLATASEDGTAKIWDLTSKKLKYTLDQHDTYERVKDNAEANQITFSPDGKHLVVISSVTHLENDDIRNTSKVKIWDPETGQLLRTIDSAKYEISNVAFNFNGSKLILAVNNSISHDQKAVIHDLKIPGSTIVLGDHTGSLNNMELSKDGSKMFTYSPERNIVSIWDTKESKILITLKIESEKSTDFFSKPVMHFNDDASKLIYSLNSEVRIYSTKNGVMVSRFLIPEETISDFNIMPDQQKIIAVTYKINKAKEKVIIRVAEWEITAGKYLRTLYEFVKPYYTLEKRYFRFSLPEISHDNRMLLVFSENTDSVKVQDVQTGIVIASFSGHNRSQIVSAHFNPDNKKIIIASGSGGGGEHEDYQVSIWDIASRKVIAKQNNPKLPYIKDAFFLPDSNRVLTVYWNDSLQKVWNGRTGAELLKISSKNLDKVYASPNGKRIVIVSSSPFYVSDRLELWDTEKGRLIKIMEGHSGKINSVLYTPNSDFIITTSDDKTLKKWNAQTGQLLFTAFVIDSGDYLVIDTYGRYDGSEAARKSLYFMCNDEMIDLEQFEKLCWEPGLASKLQGFNKEPISAQKLTDINICNFTPEVEARGIVSGNYDYMINERKGGIGEIQLFINGKQIKAYKPGNLIRNGSLQYRLSVPAKELERYFSSGVANRITVKATTKDNSMTSRGGDGEGPVLDKKKGNPNMYIVSIGINEYKGEALKLHYASTDAESFAGMLKPAAQKLLNTDNVQHIKNYVFSTENSNPNKPFKKAIKEQFTKIAAECTADDILVIFFAGHGVLQGAEKKFYLLTADAAAFNLNGVENEVAISFDELSEWMRNIVANKQVLIMDACNSGEAVDAQHLLGKREIPADLARAQENLKDQTGIYMLAASASGRPAFEASQFGQGLLTYSLLNGIKNQEAILGNGFIDITKWFSSAARNVSELAREVGERQDPKIIGNQSFAVGLVDAALLNAIQLPVRKPVFKQSQIKTLAMTDKLKLTQSVDSILNVHAAMGRESSLTFVESNKSADAYSIRGFYKVENNKIIVQISLIQGEESTGYQFEKTGAVSEVNTLGMAITDEIIGYLKKMNKN